MAHSEHSLHCFKVIGNAIDKSIKTEQATRKVNLQEISEEVAESVIAIRDEYFSNKVPNIPFDNPRFRQAYLYWAAPANALALESVLDLDIGLQQWINAQIAIQERLKVCCIGGGPGSEILGLAKWVERNSSGPLELCALVTDKFLDWGENWFILSEEINRAIAENYSKDSHGLPIIIKGNFAEVDVQNIEHLARVKTDGNHDIYIMSYLLSHLFSNKALAVFNRFMTDVIKNASSGTRFIFVDRAANFDIWKKPVRQLAYMSGLKLSPSRQIPSYSEEDCEEEENLGSLFDKVGSLSRPSNAFWVTGTKV